MRKLSFLRLVLFFACTFACERWWPHRVAHDQVASSPPIIFIQKTKEISYWMSAVLATTRQRYGPFQVDDCHMTQRRRVTGGAGVLWRSGSVRLKKIESMKRNSPLRLIGCRSTFSTQFLWCSSWASHPHCGDDDVVVDKWPVIWWWRYTAELSALVGSLFERTVRAICNFLRIRILLDQSKPTFKK